MLRFLLSLAFAAAVIPTAPPTHVMDAAGVLSAQTKIALEQQLLAHERATTNQVVVAIFGELGDQDLVDYTNRVFKEWKIGQASKNNGVLLALYWKDHKIRIEVGYGLEAVLTDAKARAIIEERLKPSLQSGNPDRAVSEGVSGVLSVLIGSSPSKSSSFAKVNAPTIDALKLRHGDDFYDRISDVFLALVAPFLFLGALIVLFLIGFFMRQGGTITGNRSGGGYSGGGGNSGGGGASGNW